VLKHLDDYGLAVDIYASGRGIVKASNYTAEMVQAMLLLLLLKERVEREMEVIRRG
jgi:PHD/YefM family antitoxin component YafN of YafNO toxin-antitoxin module